MVHASPASTVSSFGPFRLVPRWQKKCPPLLRRCAHAPSLRFAPTFFTPLEFAADGYVPPPPSAVSSFGPFRLVPRWQKSSYSKGERLKLSR